MGAGPSGGHAFQTTMWSMVMQAHSNREILETLLRSYWAPIYSCVRRQGYTEHDASDLTQEFMLKVVLGRELLARATPLRGRFRTFVRSALTNFLIDQHRAGRARGAAGLGIGTGMSMLSESQAAPGVDDIGDALAADFDRRWASSIMDQTLERVREHCEHEGMHDHWIAFDACVLGPTLRRQSAPSLSVMATRLSPSGAYTPENVSNMIQSVKRTFRRLLRETVASTVQSPADIDQELAELREMLALHTPPTPRA